MFLALARAQAKPIHLAATSRDIISVAARVADQRLESESELREAIIEGAALRVRPIAMTVAVIIAGFLPVMWGAGTGTEVMRRIAAPMVGGMATALLLSMFVVPFVYLLIRRHDLKQVPST